MMFFISSNLYFSKFAILTEVYQSLCDFQAKRIAEELKGKLEDLKQQIKEAMAEVVAEEFSDTTTALKQLSAAANAPIDKADRFVAVYLG